MFSVCLPSGYSFDLPSGPPERCNERRLGLASLIFLLTALGVRREWGPRSLLRSLGEHQWLDSMVYGRYNELVFMEFINQHSHHVCGQHPGDATMAICMGNCLSFLPDMFQRKPARDRRITGSNFATALKKYLGKSYPQVILVCGPKNAGVYFTQSGQIWVHSLNTLEPKKTTGKEMIDTQHRLNLFPELDEGRKFQQSPQIVRDKKHKSCVS